jgi:OPA family glycerol-3-phosphate transporter-like MFS transporter
MIGQSPAQTPYQRDPSAGQSGASPTTPRGSGWIGRILRLFEPSIKYPKGFRPRRGLNWAFLGLLYTSFYMCRYNLSFANESIRGEFGFSREQIGKIMTTAMLAYAFGQIINGLLTDRIGGKRAMLIGAAGTIVMNTLFGAASFAGLLWLFVAIRGVDGYMQAFGAPGMVKINAAWFSHRERGQFSGIFGFMINLGRFGNALLAPALLGGFAFLWLIHVPPQHWRTLFWVPSVICVIVAAGMAICVKETPEEAGFPGVVADETGVPGGEVRAEFKQVFRAIVSNPLVWVTAFAYACTGAVRQSVDQWFPSYMQDLYQVDLKSKKLEWLAFLIPMVASAGSLLSGYVSDKFVKGHRAPVAAVLYFLETCIILLATRFNSSTGAIVFLVLISFTANSTHSILGSAAPMDFGGRRMAGFALGLIDSFQYFGGSLAGIVLGRLLDKNLGNYFYFMAPFGAIGGLLMLTILRREARAEKAKAQASL